MESPTVGLISVQLQPIIKQMNMHSSHSFDNFHTSTIYSRIRVDKNFGQLLPSKSGVNLYTGLKIWHQPL